MKMRLVSMWSSRFSGPRALRSTRRTATVEPVGMDTGCPLTETWIPGASAMRLLGGGAGGEVGQDELVEGEVLHDGARAFGVVAAPLDLHDDPLVLVFHQLGDGAFVTVLDQLAV